jgi:hypothetical protein
MIADIRCAGTGNERRAGIAQLPLRPQHIDVTVMQEERRIARRMAAHHLAADPDMRPVVNIAFEIGPEGVVGSGVEHAIDDRRRRKPAATTK